MSQAAELMTRFQGGLLKTMDLYFAVEQKEHVRADRYWGRCYD